MEKNWNYFIEAGERYYLISSGLVRKNRFSSDLVYNIVALCIENFLVGYLLSQGKIPENHTLLDIISYLKKFEEVGDLEERIRWMNGFQEICCLDFYKRRVPEDSDLVAMLEIASDVKRLVNNNMRAILPS